MKNTNEQCPICHEPLEESWEYGEAVCKPCFIELKAETMTFPELPTFSREEIGEGG